MNTEQLNWLIQAGRRLLAQDRSTSLHLNAWQSALLDEQSKLRHRSRDRFPDPAQWLWTDRSLQQASDWQCATFKAQLLPSGGPVIDACCGAGADLVALALRHAHVLGVDRDLAMLQLARSNVDAHQCDAAYLQAELPTCFGDLKDACLHIDPDRRQGTGRDTRTTHGEAFSPALSDCMTLGLQSRACIIKLAPATQIDLSADWSRCWLGTSRHCPQQLLLRGELSNALPAGSTAAALVGETPQLYIGQPTRFCNRTATAGQYVYDFHPALYASGLASSYAVDNALVALCHPANYFTADQALMSPWMQTYRVLAEMSWDDRRVRKWLREHAAGIVEVKTRHVSLNANDLQVRLSNSENAEGESYTLLLYQAGKSIRLIIASRITLA